MEDTAEAAAGMPSSSSSVKGEVRRARRLPHWLWVVIAKSLGIRLHAKDRPVVSAVLHVLTLGCGAGELGWH